MPKRSRQRRQLPRLSLLAWLGHWCLRLLKIALVGLTTCGLGWVWLAMYLYYERFKQRRLPASEHRRR
ncbi:hypothetical protein [Synechococcus sp. NB0720_010]|uniref:hypothetical protein n=1 Tax=Synechococcus sp. NB0720_010 TaxID=2907159 RepID=UPI001FFC25DD|nr:hypothetical protein [Synechococcus sp. NB0720_010]UPH90104.1 hypothetical protein LY254_12745 [Synechococcus sp. NB0720_010]